MVALSTRLVTTATLASLVLASPIKRGILS